MLVVPHFSPPTMIRLGSSAWRLRRRRKRLLAVGGVALARARAHRLVGGVVAALRGAVWRLGL